MIFLRNNIAPTVYLAQVDAKTKNWINWNA
jgi:hypothetical protein